MTSENAGNNAESSHTTTKRITGELRDSEYFWRDHQPWLRERGYCVHDTGPVGNPHGRVQRNHTTRLKTDCRFGFVLYFVTHMNGHRLGVSIHSSWMLLVSQME